MMKNSADFPSQQSMLQHAPLAKSTTYVSYYDPSLLFAIPRQCKRDEIGVPTPLPFQGADIWNAYELSWLDANGKPNIALAEFVFPCTSIHMIESKSFKLYLNSYHQTEFEDTDFVKDTLEKDLSQTVGEPIKVRLILAAQFPHQEIQEFSGECLDDLDVSVDTYEPNADLLSVESGSMAESVYSNLLKSNCPVTNQPDWGSVLIHYQGKKINHESLLKYIISFRKHNAFHEQCIERMYCDILMCCKPKKLTVYGRYTRRGGLDINPFRSNFETLPRNVKTFRQ